MYLHKETLYEPTIVPLVAGLIGRGGISSASTPFNSDMTDDQDPSNKRKTLVSLYLKKIENSSRKY